MQKAHDSSYNDYWKNKPNITTPIVQDQLNRIETTIDTIDDRVVTFDGNIYIHKAERDDNHNRHGFRKSRYKLRL